MKRKAQTGIRANKLTPRRNLKVKPPSTPGPADPEHSFWNTPAASARTLRFTDDLLTDEQFDSEDLSASLASPLSTVRPPPLQRTEHHAGPHRQLRFEPKQPRITPPDRGSLSFALQAQRRPLEDESQELGVEEDEEDQTVVIKRPYDNPLPRPATPPLESSPLESRAETPPIADDPEQPKRSKFKITTEFEDIIVRNNFLYTHIYSLSTDQDLGYGWGYHYARASFRCRWHWWHQTSPCEGDPVSRSLSMDISH